MAYKNSADAVTAERTSEPAPATEAPAEAAKREIPDAQLFRLLGQL